MWEIAAVIGVLLVTIWLIWRKKKLSVLKELGIPGPEPNILFGNLWELVVTEGPLECHTKWVKQYGPVSGYYFGTKPIVLVTDTELLKTIQISEFHKFPNRPNLFEVGKNKSSPAEIEGFEQSLISLRDKRWKEIRSIVTPSFTTSKMKLMSSIISKAVDDLIQNIENKAKAKETFDIYKFYQGLTMDVIGRTAFGIQTDVQTNPNSRFLTSVRVLLGASISSIITFLSVGFPEFATFWHTLRRIRDTIHNKGTDPAVELTNAVVDVIKRRRKDKSARHNDLLQLMIEAEMSEADLKNIRDQDLAAGNEETEKKKEQNSNPTSKQSSKLLRHMTDAEIVENAMLFFLAGYDTTSTALGFITHFLVNYPDVQERLRKEVQDLFQKEGSLDYSSIHKFQYMDQVITESLRIYPPVHLFVNREAGEDTKFGNMTIKKGIAIQVPIYVLQHDPDLWADPEKFDPERFSPENKSSNNPMAFQTFGAGPRNCVGMRFAQMEIKLALSQILLKYRLVPTHETEKHPLTLRVAPANMTPAKGVIVKALRL